MKRLTLLAAALVMVLGFAVNASAAPEVTVSGNILINAVWKANWDFRDDTQTNDSSDAFQIRERIDLAFTAVANENLKAVIAFRAARSAFGQSGLSDGAGGADGSGTADGTVGLALNQGYMDFNWPGTSVNVKAGFMPVALPAAVGGGSIIQDDTATGVLVSTAINDNVSLLGGWVRFFDIANNASNNDDSQIDAWILAAPLTFEGFSMAPFFVYAPLGENADATVVAFNAAGGNAYTSGLTSGNAGKAVAAGNTKVDDAYWLGSSFELSMLDPFILKADINYGVVNGDRDDMDREGWLFDIALEYTGFDFMNLEAAFAYTSGYDNDDSNDGRMPVMSDSWALGTTWFGNGLLTGDDMGSANDNMGFWALALSATGIQSFAEGLTHDVHIVYAQGTNEDRQDSTGAATNLTYGSTLLEDDSMLELDFNTFYKIYDELTLYNGIGYVNLDADDGAGTDEWANGQDGGDAWKFQVGLKYVF